MKKEDFLECPFCSCVFQTQHDLDLHLTTFGSNKDRHLVLLRQAHKKVEPSITDKELSRMFIKEK